MKTKLFLSLFLVLCLAVVFSARTEKIQAADTASFTPVAILEEEVFRFDPVIEGAVITHDFIIKNTGKAPLSIEKVKTSCGCTTADYTRQIQPGGYGKISIKGNTTGYAGRKFIKTIIAYTNDPQHGIIKMFVKGEVDTFAVIEPKIIFLKGHFGSPIQSRVTIRPLEKYPFKMIGSYADNLENKITYSLEKERDKYVLAVKNQLDKAGKYNGSIHLKTDSTVRSEIIINVIGLIT